MSPLVYVLVITGLLIVGALAFLLMVWPWCRRAFATVMSDKVPSDQMTAAIPPLTLAAKIGLVLFTMLQSAGFVLICAIEPQNLVMLNHRLTWMLCTGFTMLLAYVLSGLLIIADIYVFSADKSSSKKLPAK